MLMKNSKGDSGTRHWQEVLPWLGTITPNLVLCKDGSLLACYEYAAVDVDNVTDEKVNIATEQLERAFKGFDNRFTAWISVSKLRDHSYPKAEFTNEAAASLDEIVSRRFLAGECFNITHRIYLTYTGNTGVNKFFDTVSTLVNEHDISVPVAIIKAANPATANKNAALYDTKQLQLNIQQFEAALANFEGVLSSFTLSRKSGWDLETCLAQEANINTPPTALLKKPPTVLLDGWLSQTAVTFGREIIKCQGVTECKFAAQLVVNEYPTELNATLLDRLLTRNYELRLCHVVRFLNQEQAAVEIKAGLDYFQLTQFSLATRIVSKLSNKPPVARAGKHDLYLQCLEAERERTAKGLGFSLHSISVSVFGDTVQGCEDNVREFSRLFSDAGFSILRERTNLTSSFASMLPGQWATQVRLNLQNNRAVADCLPIFTCPTGSKYHEYFSKDVFNTPVPALSVFRNVYGGKAYYDTHVSQVGHAVLIAPTGGGKTTFVNFAASQMKKYPNSNVYIFDRDLSCRITTELMGGVHVDMRLDKIKLNPMAALRDGSSDGALWLREFVIRRLSEGGYEADALDRNAIDVAISNLKASTIPLRLSVLAMQLPPKLRNQLAEWLEGKPYGMFDSFEDDFEVHGWTCIEMKEIMDNERIGRAYLDYAFRKILLSLDGTPTFIYLEEASFLLNNPAFSSMIDDWLKTLRKKNGFLWLTLQSPSSITNSAISATLLDNIKSIIVMANNKVEAHRESYKKNFGMTDEQISMIASLLPARQYMLIKNGVVRILETMFDHLSLPYLRSEIFLQNKFDDYRKTGNPNWKLNYIKDLQGAPK